jgi:hypothetical protein
LIQEPELARVKVLGEKSASGPRSHAEVGGVHGALHRIIERLVLLLRLSVPDLAQRHTFRDALTAPTERARLRRLIANRRETRLSDLIPDRVERLLVGVLELLEGIGVARQRPEPEEATLRVLAVLLHGAKNLGRESGPWRHVAHGLTAEDLDVSLRGRVYGLRHGATAALHGRRFAFRFCSSRWSIFATACVPAANAGEAMCRTSTGR